MFPLYEKKVVSTYYDLIEDWSYFNIYETKATYPAHCLIEQCINKYDRIGVTIGGETYYSEDNLIEKMHADNTTIMLLTS